VCFSDSRKCLVISIHRYRIPDVIPGRKCHKHKFDFQGHGMLHNKNTATSTYTRTALLDLQYMLKRNPSESRYTL